MKRLRTLGVLAVATLAGVAWAADPEATLVANKTSDKVAAAAVAGPLDWNQWGGSNARNNVAQGKNIPAEWDIGEIDEETGEWDSKYAENIKWVAKLGSQTYGNPVIANGQVYVGTNNGAGWLKRYPNHIDLGCLLAFRESDGEFLWQHSSEKLPTGRVHDWPLQGICCAPLVEGERLWFVTSRGLVVCLDTHGFYNGVDTGPVQNQWGRMFDLVAKDDPSADQVAPAKAELDQGKLPEVVADLLDKAGAKIEGAAQVEVAEAGKRWNFTATVDGHERKFYATMEAANRLSCFKMITVHDKHEADVIWEFDMMTDLGVSQHNMCSCSVTSAGDVLFVCTGNGVDEGHINLPAPEAPSFLAMDKNTGKVLWTDKSPGLNILHGQWASPAYAVLGGQPQVMFAGGDAWIYSFDPAGDGQGNAKLLWKFDANPKESKYILGGRGTRNEIIGTPVIYNDLVYLAVGQDPEHGEGIGHLWCIDPTKRGDVSPELAFKVDDLKNPIPHRRLQAVDPTQGEVARPNPNSAMVWHYSEYDLDGDGKIKFEETMHRTCGTVVIKDDLLFIADFSGLFHCVDAKTGVPYWTHDLFAECWGSALIVDDRVYVGDAEGKVTVFRVAKEKDLIAENDMGNAIYSTPVVANNTLFISNKNRLFAIAGPDEAAEQ